LPSSLRVRGPLLAAWACAFALCFTACEPVRAGRPLPDMVDEVNATLQPNVIVLQPGDSVQVKFLSGSNIPGAHEFDHSVTILPDGTGYFQLLGSRLLDGMTLDELETMLKEEYGKVLVSTDLVVRPATLRPRQVTFMGEVGSGPMEITPRLTIDLIEAFGRVGGPKSIFSLLEHTAILRWMPEEKQRRVFIVDASRKYWYSPRLLYLQANDIVYVPRHPISTIGDWSRELLRVVPFSSQILFNVGGRRRN
jgi:protein involved in polysaccharide export with SLBB domain